MLELIKYIVEQFAEEKDAISYDVEETEDTITVTVLLAVRYGQSHRQTGQDRQGAPHARARGNAQGQQEVQRGDQGTPSGVNGFPRALCGKKPQSAFLLFFAHPASLKKEKGKNACEIGGKTPFFCANCVSGRAECPQSARKKFPCLPVYFGGKGCKTYRYVV